MSSTGSLINHIQGDRTKQPEPFVGQPATILRWTDRDAATVVAVSASGKSVTIRQDDAKLISGSTGHESQQYEYTIRAYGVTDEVYTLRKNGSWVRKGSSLNGGGRVALGNRNSYRDPCF